MDYFNHIMKRKDQITRREFMKYSALALGGLAIGGRAPVKLVSRLGHLFEEGPLTPDFPVNVPLGRMCVGEPGARVDIFSEPFHNAKKVSTAWYDDVFVWKQEVITKQIAELLINQRWVETPEGFIYADYLQKVMYTPQEPLNQLPVTETGERGMWVEIVAPYTGLVFDSPPAQYWLRETIRPRIYYSQIFWAFDIRQDPTSGKTQYCLRQLYGALDDTYWVDANVCRQITPEEIAPIHPDAPDKHIIINLMYQTVSCFEGDKEVFFTRVTTGGYDNEVGKWLTPVGVHTIWRKLLSTHMSASEMVGNYDIAGVGWTIVFDNNGAAIHSTFWHNFYGTTRSHGCVNVRPEDAKWIWRWASPEVAYYPGELTIQGLGQSTKVEVVVA